MSTKRASQSKNAASSKVAPSGHSHTSERSAHRTPEPASPARKQIPTSRQTPDRLPSWASRLSEMDVIERAKAGILGSELMEIQAGTNFSNQEWARFLQINPRTILRFHQHPTNRIDSAVSERTLLVAQLVEQGREVFGAEDRFLTWLRTPSFSLGGVAPDSLLDTTTGIGVVRSELGRIEYGVY